MLGMRCDAYIRGYYCNFLRKHLPTMRRCILNAQLDDHQCKRHAGKQPVTFPKVNQCTGRVVGYKTSRHGQRRYVDRRCKNRLVYGTVCHVHKTERKIEPKIESKQCHTLTLSGHRCTNPTVRGDVCRVHSVPRKTQKVKTVSCQGMNNQGKRCKKRVTGYHLCGNHVRKTEKKIESTEKKRCCALTSDGSQCTYQVSNEDLCGLHSVPTERPRVLVVV